MIKDKFYTVSEAAKVSDFSPDHIRRLLLDGYLKGQKVGNYWLIEHKDLHVLKRRRQKKDLSNGSNSS